ncbi:hypothetical protein, conserved [Trypanosoma brucei gambiense DAL972]|uniref:DUF2779 domain-containing protein n=2 Tax=Trypanosoma brucei TaxID=5691 RepID=D0A7K6_TRYB9|nr:hypothetical protein, conserved [Trypanosoma brucei gambiense DAL972]CBH17657.1 hypothetical protein, conserved [Trypanosoma brucei gambiense DAL972]|eukprot:XP_011779921.1 hypothetical protein, conserved [Trypanosoma brucei gambiense DAL972]
MFRKKAHSTLVSSVVDAVKKVNDADEPLRHVLRSYREASEPMSDLDECLEGRGGSDNKEKSSEGTTQRVTSSAARSPAILTYKGFAASLTCPKKFHLLQNHTDLTSDISIADAVHLDDGAAFNELARRWDRLQFGSRAVVVQEQNFEDAVRRSEEILLKYFQTVYAQLGDQAPALTIHRPAFATPFGGQSRGSQEQQKVQQGGKKGAADIILRARPAVLRFRPKDNQWVILETASALDPAGNPVRLAQYLQRLHFTTVAFRYWITQPHIPIGIRKRFLDIDLDTVTEKNLKGHRLETAAEVAVPLDLKRSGLLHIRQFFPGPVTLMDCDPTRLVKYVQRLSLEDMIDADINNSQRSGSAFGTGEFPSSGEQDITKLQAEVEAMQERGHGRQQWAGSTSNRTAKKREVELRKLFAKQQKLVEALISTRTLRLVEMGREPANAQKWRAFASDTDAVLKATFVDEGESGMLVDDQEDKGKKGKAAKAKQGPTATGKGGGRHCATQIPCVPTYSEFIGAHCSRGDVCPFFAEGLCLPNKFDEPIRQRDNHLFTVPSTAVSRKTTWWLQGLRTVQDVLYQYKKGAVNLTAPQLRYVKAITAGKVFVNPKEIEDFFSRIRYPAFLIDFEATQFALPPFEKVVAFQPLPFQFSLDVFQEDVLNETPTHYDFLHFGKGYSPNEDPRRACIAELMHIVRKERAKKRDAMTASGELARLERLKKQLEEEEFAAVTNARRGRRATKARGPNITKNNPLHEPVNFYDGCFIAHFASFEKSCLEKLGQLVDEYKEEIKQFYFLDTLDLFKRGFVHPNAHGSNSLKKVLPGLCPDFKYGVFGGDAAGDVVDAGEGEGSGGGGRQDEQKGENAMGVYRLWYHHEGGGSLRDLQQTVMQDERRRGIYEGKNKLDTMVQAARPDVRDKAWAMLRIQLLEYCSLDTKALYEIMRQVWLEKESAKGLKPDKGGWVMTDPLPREYRL